MDVVADLLARARARGALFANWTAHAPWGMTFTDDVALSFHAVLEGELWVQVHGQPEPQRLLQGDVMLIAGGQTYAFTHERGAPAPTTIADMPERAVRERTFDFPGAGAKTHVVCGAFTFQGSICSSLLEALPPLVVDQSWLLTYLAQTATLIVLALSYNLLLGETGLLSFGHAVYSGLGAFAAAHAFARFGVPLPLLPMIGGCAAMLVAVVFGAAGDKSTSLVAR